MKIAIPVAAYHVYNTAVYARRAFERLGHDTSVITQGEFYEDQPDVDLFFGVDSAGPLNFPDKHLHKTTMWFIDSRHNNNPSRRQPDDDTNAMKIHSGGGWVFQAQKRDWARNVEQGMLRCCWLPLAADPQVWWQATKTIKQYDVGFGGNVWDGVRADVLRRISERFLLNQVTGSPAELAAAYAESRVGFNISSFYGSPVCYDINMRVFEIASCGLPLITNRLPEMLELGFIDEHNCLTYGDIGQALRTIERVLGWTEGSRQAVGLRARSLILGGHTYVHRMEEALEVLQEAGVIEDGVRDNKDAD